ncbi:TPA: hypothetical protein ACXNQ3_001353 [Serratia marcescens]
MTLTTEQLRARAESLGLDFFIERRAGIWVKEWLNDGCTSATDEEVMMWSMLANREARPVMWVHERKLSTDVAITKDAAVAAAWESEGLSVKPLYTPPPAPAVPEEMKRDPDADVFDPGFMNGWNACRATMLAQPVSSGYTLPENVREALTLALQAMEFMGDTLNNIDAVCTEDVEYVTPAFNSVRELLAAAPEGGNEKNRSSLNRLWNNDIIVTVARNRI